MPDTESPIFTVEASGDPVVLRINGRASYLTSAPVNQLFSHLFDRGQARVLVDFSGCTGMDSTFLGILAGAAMRIRRDFPGGRLELANLGPRNLELVRNLGLHRILSVRTGDPSRGDRGGASGGKALPSGEVEAGSILEAHENLVSADERNAAKFQDVIQYLKKEV
ncbi:MAG: STAS domain-containing protein [Puniceicoccaceae bacterium]